MILTLTKAMTTFTILNMEEHNDRISNSDPIYYLLRITLYMGNTAFSIKHQSHKKAQE